MDTSVLDKVLESENFASTKDNAENDPNEMADCSDEIPSSSQNFSNLHLNTTGTINDNVDLVSVKGTLSDSISQDTGGKINKDVTNTDRGHTEIKIEEVFQSYPLARDDTPENLQLTDVNTCSQDGNSGLLNTSTTINDYCDVLPEEIQAELTAHAQYHHLKSTTEQNLSQQGQVEILERNPDSHSRNPDPDNESHVNIKHEPNEQYGDCDSENVGNGNYYGSESSYISNDSSAHHQLPAGLFPEESVTSMEKSEIEIHVNLHHEVPANKKSWKKNSASNHNKTHKSTTHLNNNYPNSKSQANFSKVHKKRGRPKKSQLEKTSQFTESCTSYLNGSERKFSEDKKLQYSLDLEKILKFKLSPCSVRLSRLESIETNSRTNGLCEQTSVIRTAKKRQKIAKAEPDITFNDDIENVDVYNHVEISDDEYTPENNHSLHKAFLKSSKPYKMNDHARSSGLKRKTKSSKVGGKQIKKEISNGKQDSKGTSKAQVLDRFLCKKCGFRANRQRILQQHNKEEHSLPWITCQFCDKKFKSPDCLLEHEAKFHIKGKPFKCHVDGCEYASSNRTDLSRHQSKHSTEKVHVCPLCGWTTKWPKNIRVHYLLKHTEKKKFKCNLCKYTCKRNSDLRQHMFRHTNDKPIQCLVCGFSVKTNWELKSHMLSHSDERPFKCNYPDCEFATKTNADRLKHVRMVHTVERKYICSVCSKGFKTKQTLDKHYSYSHVIARAFKCDICCKAFKLKSALKKHVLLHAGYKPYVCTVCNHAFGTSSNLRTHMETHDFTTRPYRCPLCPHGAKKKEHLLAHIGTCHSNTSCYCCEFCKKPFQSYAKLQVHYKKMHRHELAKLNSEDQIDLALLKMEMDLEEEKYSRRKNKTKKKTNKNKVQEETTVQIKIEPQDDEYENIGTESTAKCGIVNTAETTTRTDIVHTTLSLQEVCDTSRDEALKSGSETATSADDELSQLMSDVNDEVNFSVSETEATFADNESVQSESEKQNETNKIEYSNLQDGSDPFVANETKVSDSLASKSCFTVAIYNGLRLPLATRGFEFNYEKSGQKPKAWFMDVEVMNKRDAEKQKAYLRRIGQLPSLKGKYKRKVCSKQRKKKRCMADPISRMKQSEKDVESTQLKSVEKSISDEDRKVKTEDMNFQNTHKCINNESEKLSKEQTLPHCIYNSTGTEVRKGEKRKKQMIYCKVNSSMNEGNNKKFKAIGAVVEKKRSECRRTVKKGRRRNTQIKDRDFHSMDTDTTNIHKTSSEICDNKSCGSFNLPDVNNFCDDVVVMKKYEQLHTVLGEAITISTEMPDS